MKKTVNFSVLVSVVLLLVSISFPVLSQETLGHKEIKTLADKKKTELLKKTKKEKEDLIEKIESIQKKIQKDTINIEQNIKAIQMLEDQYIETEKMERINIQLLEFLPTMVEFLGETRKKFENTKEEIDILLKKHEAYLTKKDMFCQTKEDAIALLKFEKIFNELSFSTETGRDKQRKELYEKMKEIKKIEDF